MADEAGFTLLETVCVVAIVAMIAAVLLPMMPHGTSRARLEAYAIEAAALLKRDRSAALRSHIEVATLVDAPRRALRSGASGQVLRLPDDVMIRAVLPQVCNQRPAFSTISFFPSGMSCGGAIALTRNGAGYEIKVNWFTGGIELVSRSAS